jgi:hypothetical protein
MEPVLAHPVLTDPFELEVDASGFTMGVVLYKRRKMARNIPLPTIPKPSVLQSEIMTYMT